MNMSKLILMLLISSMAYSTEFIAHRGDSHNHLENSLVAFRSAIEMGVGIEIDIRHTQDGKPIVMHDETLARTGIGDRCLLDTPIPQLTLHQIRTHCRLKNGESIPLLEDVLRLVNNIYLIPDYKDNPPSSTRLAVSECNYKRLKGPLTWIAAWDGMPSDLILESVNKSRGAVILFSVNKPDRIKQLLGLSVDYIVTDNPELALEVRYE